MYGYQCEYCEGTVEPKLIEREAFKHKKGFVILENVTVGICNSCGNRYYDAHIIRGVHEIATGIKTAERTEMIPVAHLS
jgi:YgiT-type zinc finger domain-containing protein